MKIPNVSSSDEQEIVCPWCNCRRWWRYGSYRRTYFHSRMPQAVSESRRVQRYLCRNKVCERTFSRLPGDVVPYCRFFWPDLLSVACSLAAGESSHRLARHVWHVGRGVITRARTLIHRLTQWLETLCREITDGAVPGGLEAMAVLTHEHCDWGGLTNLWCRRIYPGRF
jgi:transposase-like protein